MSLELPSSLSPSQIVTKISNTVTGCVLLFMETAAQLSLGQTIFRFVDRFLWVVEKSAQWSLPAQETVEEENGNTFGKIEFVRPLPWIFFLPVLVLIRLFRVGLNIGLSILGYPSVEPAAMVKFLQKVRKRLRCIKSNAMKNTRQRNICGKGNDSNMNEAQWKLAQLLRTIQMTLSSLSCLDVSKLSPSPPPTRIKVHMNHESTPTPEEQSTTESAMHVESKRKYSKLSPEDSEAETVGAKLDRLAAVNDSIDDEDFNPDDLSSLAEDSPSMSGESVSATELEDIQEMARSLPPIPMAPPPQEQSTTESAMYVNRNAEVGSEDQQSEDSDAETVQAKLDRLAAADDSVDDEDFNPDDLSSLADDSPSTSGDSVSATELQDIQDMAGSISTALDQPEIAKPGELKAEYASTSGDSSVSESELASIRNEANLIFHRASARVTEVINEQTEPNNHTSVAQSTSEGEKFANSKARYTPEKFDDYYSPCKLSDEGETGFYSPISSTSPSPDRKVSAVKQGQEIGQVEETRRTNVRQNGEPISNTSTQISGSTDQTSNGHSSEKGNVPLNIPTKTTKSHHRGRRGATHMSRKKK